MKEPPAPQELEALSARLRRRLEVIGDTDWRDSDPDGQLEGLKKVSQEIMALHASLQGRIHPRLEHFLTNCSYDKALEYLETELSS